MQAGPQSAMQTVPSPGHVCIYIYIYIYICMYVYGKGSICIRTWQGLWTVCVSEWVRACMTVCVHLACCLGKCCVFRWSCHAVYSLESTAALPMSGLHTYRAVLVSGPMVKCRATPRPSAATPGIPRRHRAEPRRVRGPRSKSVTNPRCRPVAPVRRCWSCRGRQISW